MLVNVLISSVSDSRLSAKDLRQLPFGLQDRTAAVFMELHGRAGAERERKHPEAYVGGGPWL